MTLEQLDTEFRLHVLICNVCSKRSNPLCDVGVKIAFQIGHVKANGQQPRET